MNDSENAPLSDTDSVEALLEAAEAMERERPDLACRLRELATELKRQL